MDTTIVKGFVLLEVLAQNDAPQSVSVLASHLGLPKSNVHRTLSTLVALGYAKQDPITGLYASTLRSWELGMRVMARNPLKRAAMPFMQALQRQTAESVNLTVLDGFEVVYLDKVATHYPLISTADPGWRVPAIYPASGQVLLAYASDVEQLLHATAAAVSQARTLDVAKTLRTLSAVRKRGYAVSLSGWRPGINSIAAIIPMRVAGQGQAASLSISGPAERLSQALMSGFVASLQGACAQIGETLGGVEIPAGLFGTRTVDNPH